MNKFVFWWSIPCSGMMGVFKSYCESIDKESVVITGTLSESRKMMGWEETDKITANHIIIQDNEWNTKAVSLLLEYRNYLHVFNGIGYPARINNLILTAIKENIRFCNMSEAYSNLESGIRSVIKSIYIRFYLPLKIRKIAQHCLGVLCLSGSNPSHIKQFKRLGFKSDSIYSFGYYTDENTDYVYNALNDGKIHILCPGLHEKYKGVDILIRALAIVVANQTTNFVCHITGKGSQTAYLKCLVTQLKLQDFIRFEGVLNALSYHKLLSHIDMLIAPGRVEPWGIRVNEAIQRGNIVIVSNKIGASELIAQSGGGQVFQSGNIYDLSEKIELYLQNQALMKDAKEKNLDFKDNISCSKQAGRLFRYLNIMIKR
jgi:glycosyltransferase involved in cell wall biosynthesis